MTPGTRPRATALLPTPSQTLLPQSRTLPQPSVAHAARQRHIEALSRRAQQQAEGPARHLMEQRVQQLRDALAAAEADKPQAPTDGRRAGTQPAAKANYTLAQLLAHINGPATPLGPDTQHRHTAGANSGSTALPSAAANPELKAISQFRSTWSRLGAERRLNQALAKVPHNAGPLNTQRLLHQALEAMRNASPHYLHRFMVQVETLLWLEQLSLGAAPVDGKKPATRKPRG